MPLRKRECLCLEESAHFHLPLPKMQPQYSALSSLCVSVMEGAVSPVRVVDHILRGCTLLQCFFHFMFLYLHFNTNINTILDYLLDHIISRSCLWEFSDHYELTDEYIGAHRSTQ